jgi:hypothetical protein
MGRRGRGTVTVPHEAVGPAVLVADSAGAGVTREIQARNVDELVAECNAAKIAALDAIAQRDTEREQHALWRGRYEGAKEEVERLRAKSRGLEKEAWRQVKRAEAAEAALAELREQQAAAVPGPVAEWRSWEYRHHVLGYMLGTCDGVDTEGLRRGVVALEWLATTPVATIAAASAADAEVLREYLDSTDHVSLYAYEALARATILAPSDAIKFSQLDPVDVVPLLRAVRAWHDMARQQPMTDTNECTDLLHEWRIAPDEWKALADKEQS